MSGERGPTVETKPATDGGNTAVETKVPEKKAETPVPGLRRYIIPAASLLLEGGGEPFLPRLPDAAAGGSRDVDQSRLLQCRCRRP